MGLGGHLALAVAILYGHAAMAEDLTLEVRKLRRGKQIAITVTRSTSDACTLNLYGARSRAALLDPSKRVVLASTDVQQQISSVTATRVPLLRVRRRSRPNVFTQAETICSGDQSLSPEVGFKPRTSLNAGVRKVKRWISSLAARLNAQSVRLVQAFPSLSFTQPLDLQSPPDGTNRLFVVEQGGRIRVFPNDAAVSSSSLFLDIRSKISSGGERGLLGLAFHPEYGQNRFFFVNYTRAGDGATVISRYRARAGNPNEADPASELILLVVEQPFSNHNGGGLAFGPDGYLYIGLGDGGSGGDPQNNGQDLTTLLGSFLRIDVDNTSGGRNYAIPSDNPFVSGPAGARAEIFAYGFRNPFRFSFDSATGRLWAGDVGQGSREEIDIVEKGGNYGWRIMEGRRCFNPPSGCDMTGLILPVTDYTRDLGISVTGGYVYRGSSLPGLIGRYIYGDFGSGRIWSLDGSGNSSLSSELFDTDLNISAFGVDSAKELYVVSYGDGKLYRLVP